VIAVNQFANKIALITGASSGIGALVDELATDAICPSAGLVQV